MAASCDESSNLDNFSDSDLTDVKSEQICGVCDETLTAQAAFRCDTCQLFNEARTEETVFCEFCIAMSHVRKGHEVIDYKGYKPAICGKHRMLCLMFCYDCQAVFCFKCLGPHCNHKYSTVSEKASEVRKEVFQCLNSFDELAKPFKRRENEMKQVFEERQRCLSALDHKNLEKTLSKCFINAIKESAPELEKLIIKALSEPAPQSNTEVLDEAKLNAVCQISKNTDENVIRLRELLLMSEGVSVEKFLQLSDGLHSLIEANTKELDFYVSLDWCSNWEDIARDCIEKSVKMLQVPKVRRSTWRKNKCIESLPFDTNIVEVSIDTIAPKMVTFAAPHTCELIEIFDVKKTKESVDFRVLFHICWTNGKVSCRKRKIGHFSLKFSGVVAMFSSKELVGFTCDRGTFCFDAVKQTPVINFEIPESNFIPDFSVLFNDDRSLTVCRKFNHLVLDGFDVDAINLRYCPQQPKFVIGSGEMTAFVENNIVTIVNTKTKIALQVFPIHHQLHQIDCLVFNRNFIERILITLFDYKARSSLRCEIGLTSMSSMFWRVTRADKFEVPSDEAVLHCSMSRNDFTVATNKTSYVFSN